MCSSQESLGWLLLAAQCIPNQYYHVKWSDLTPGPVFSAPHLVWTEVERPASACPSHHSTHKHNSDVRGCGNCWDPGSIPQQVCCCHCCVTDKEQNAKHLTINKVKKRRRGFHGGSTVKNLPDSGGDTGLIPDSGRFHMLQSSYAHVPQLLNLCSRA